MALALCFRTTLSRLSTIETNLYDFGNTSITRPLQPSLTPPTHSMNAPTSTVCFLAYCRSFIAASLVVFSKYGRVFFQQRLFSSLIKMRQHREQPQPELAAFICRQLPLVDEHNNKRQGELSLETCLPTMDAFFRIFASFTGFSVANYRNSLDWCIGNNVSANEAANMIGAGLILRKRHH